MLSPTTRSNVRRLYADMLWFGVLNGSAMAFLNIYAARLGASALQISWLTAGPAMLNLVVSLPAGRWLEKRPLARATYSAGFFQRIGYAVMVLLPLLHLEPEQMHAMIWIVLAMSLPATVFAIGFNALFAEVIPAEARADVVGRRNALLAISLTVSTMLSGWILDAVVFPHNYQIIFAIGAIGGMLSVYNLSRLRRAPETAEMDDEAERERREQPVASRLVGIGAAANRPSIPGPVMANEAARTALSLREEMRRLANRLASPAALRLSRPDLGLLRGDFGRFMAAYLLFYTFQYLPLPIFPLAYVNVLKLTDGMIGLGSGMFYITMFLVSLRLGRLVRRWGHHRLLWVSAALFSVYPLGIGLAKGPVVFWITSILGGGIYAVIYASLINRLMERTPEKGRAAGMALHNLSLNLGILVGSFSGSALSGWLGLQPSLLYGAGLRFLAGLLMAIWG